MEIGSGVVARALRRAIHCASVQANCSACGTTEAVAGGSSHWRAIGSALCGRRWPSKAVISNL
jgi:hypothetical protein